jgi:hypothetical protein
LAPRPRTPILIRTHNSQGRIITLRKIFLLKSNKYWPLAGSRMSDGLNPRFATMSTVLFDRCNELNFCCELEEMRSSYRLLTLFDDVVRWYWWVLWLFRIENILSILLEDLIANISVIDD